MQIGRYLLPIDTDVCGDKHCHDIAINTTLPTMSYKIPGDNANNPKSTPSLPLIHSGNNIGISKLLPFFLSMDYVVPTAMLAIDAPLCDQFHLPNFPSTFPFTCTTLSRDVSVTLHDNGYPIKINKASDRATCLKISLVASADIYICTM